MIPRLCDHEAGHLLVSIDIVGTTHCTVIRGDDYVEVRRYPLKPPTYESVIDTQVGGIAAEMFMAACGDHDRVIEWAAGGVLDWAAKYSPFAEFDLTVLRFFSQSELLASTIRAIDCFRDVSHVTTMGDVVQRHLDGLSVGESAMVYRCPSLKHLSLQQLQAQVDAEILAMN